MPSLARSSRPGSGSATSKSQLPYHIRGQAERSTPFFVARVYHNTICYPYRERKISIVYAPNFPYGAFINEIQDLYHAVN